MSSRFWASTLVCVLYSSFSLAVVIGSYKTVSKEAFASFPAQDDDNEMRGFASFSRGFTLNGGGSCDFNALFPVGGSAILNGGTLNLSQDLTFLEDTTFYNGGYVKGNNNQMIFLNTDQLQLPLRGNISSTVSYVTQTETGNEISKAEWSYDKKYLAAIKDDGRNVCIFDFINQQLVKRAQEQSESRFLTLAHQPNDTNILSIQESWVELTDGTRSLVAATAQLWNYDAQLQSLTLVHQIRDDLNISDGCWHPSGKYIAFRTGALSDKLAIYAFIDAQLVYLSTCDVTPSLSNLKNELTWDEKGRYLLVGTGLSDQDHNDASELSIYGFDGQNLVRNALLHTDISLKSMRYLSTGNRIVGGISNQSQKLQTYLHDAQLGVLTLQEGQAIDDAQSLVYHTWSPDGRYFALARQKQDGIYCDVHAYDTDENKLELLKKFKHGTTLSHMRWSPQSDYLALADGVDRIAIFNRDETGLDYRVHTKGVSPVTSCDWSFDSAYVGALNSTSVSFGIYQLTDTTLRELAQEDTKTNFLSLEWHPSDYYILTGREQGADEPNVQIWYYQPQENTIRLITQLEKERNITAVCWHPSGNYIAVRTVGDGDDIIIYSFNGAQLEYVTSMELDPSQNNSQNSLSWNPDGTYLVVGSAITEKPDLNQLVIYQFDGSSLYYNCSAEIHVGVDAVSYAPNGNYVAVGLASGSDCLQVYYHDVDQETLTPISSMSIEEPISVLAVTWSPDGNYIAMGRAAGKGTEFRVYYVDRKNEKLVLIKAYDIAGDVNTVSWSPDGNYIAIGDSITFVSIYDMQADKLRLVFDDIKLTFNCDVTFNATTLFENKCSINGTNHALTLSKEARIIVGKEATLALKDITLTNIHGKTFYCADSSSKITFDNVTIEMTEDNYDFINGSFDVKSSLQLKGPNAFNYWTMEQSNILSNAQLVVERGSTFNYAPYKENNSLLQFEDSTSTLVLHSATLQTSYGGMQVLRGVVEIDGKSYIVSKAKDSSQGVMLGDGESIENNAHMRFLPGSSCNVLSGTLVDMSVVKS